MLKKITAEILKKAAQGSVKNATASAVTCGLEKMPESMKKSR